MAGYDDFTILLVDDEEEILFSFGLLLRGAGIDKVVSTADSRDVMSILQREPVSVVMLDLNMPHIPGFELLGQIRRDYPHIPVIIVTAANEIEMAIECMKAGAADYFVKPVEKHRLLSSIGRLRETANLANEVSELKTRLLGGKLQKPEAFEAIITRNPDMLSMFRYLEAIGPSPQPVLVTGATGTGKELVARAVHRVSGRRGKFVAVNVAGVDDHVFTDTLFGHTRGAFTGADGKREGLVARAAKGTLFLDEVGELPESSQVKLLRLLQEGEYYPLGADAPLKSEARVVVATNRNLRDEVAARRFRQDLYYRLCAHQVDILPLAKRPEDLPLLVDAFLEEAADTLGKKKPTPPPELFQYLLAYDFPGNVRELRALVMDAVARHERGVLSLDVFTRALGAASPVPPSADASRMIYLADPNRVPTLKEAEDFLMKRALELAQGNQGVAATYLGITRQGLNKKLSRRK